MKNDPMYARRLENLPEEKKKAFLYGDWDSFQGMAFEEWDYNIHVCKPFTIPAHWRKWVAADNGYTDPFAFYWFAVSEEGVVYVYREYTREYSDSKVIYSDQARKVMELNTYIDPDDGVEKQENIDYYVVGHDAFNTHPLSENGKTIVDYYNEGGIYGCIRAITDRKLRKATIHEYLKPFEDENTGKMTAKVQIFSTCHKLIEYLPLQVEDPKDPEKYAETKIDHWPDAFGYGLISYHVAASKGLPETEPPIAKHKNKMARRGRRFRRTLS